VALLIRNRHKKQAQDKRQNDKWIANTLYSITNEANRKRLNIHATPKIDVAEAFGQLRQLAAAYPDNITSRIDDMETRWRELDSRLAEFISQQKASSTLQSSILTSRTSKLANDLSRLADEIQENLDR
jgi:hypothetical protein